MKFTFSGILLFLILASVQTAAQNVSPRDVNAARNVRGQGTSLDTNASFSLSMRLQGQDTLIDSASLSDSVTISAIIRPDFADVGEPADIIIVDASAASGFTMRNQDGNFVTWNGKVPDLVPYMEAVPLEAETAVDIFSGQLGISGSHRIFVGFLVGDALYFTPSALKFSITEPAPEPEPEPEPEPSARDRAIALFDSTISPTIVQVRCIQCHVRGGLADGRALHIFVRSTDPNHLTTNFGIFENLFRVRGRQYILDKVQGLRQHGGAVQLSPSSQSFRDLDSFLQLLEQASGTNSQSLTDQGGADTGPIDTNDPYAYGDYL